MNSRKHDPKSSKIAGAIHELSGKASFNRNKVLDLVKAHPDLTSKELAQASSNTGLDRWEIARRLPELRERNLVEVSGYGKRKQMKWRAVA